MFLSSSDFQEGLLGPAPHPSPHWRQTYDPLWPHLASWDTGNCKCLCWLAPAQARWCPFLFLSLFSLECREPSAAFACPGSGPIPSPSSDYSINIFPPCLLLYLTSPPPRSSARPQGHGVSRVVSLENQPFAHTKLCHSQAQFSSKPSQEPVSISGSMLFLNDARNSQIYPIVTSEPPQGSRAQDLLCETLRGRVSG